MKKRSDLTIICCACNALPKDRIDTYLKKCNQLILVCAAEIKSHENHEVIVLPWLREKGKVAALNKAIQKATGTHILLTEENEALPQIPRLKENIIYPARISNTEAEVPVVNWQIRLFPNPGSGHSFFTGFEIPVINPAFCQSGIQYSNHPLRFNRSGELFPAEDIRREVENGSDFIMHEFWKGLLATGEKQFISAVRCFKNVLKNDEITNWYRLAALNSLANALTESYKLEEAKKIAQKSLAISCHQRAPYLMLYQYYNLNGESERAYQQLVQYQKAATYKTEANWDIYLPKAHVAFLMAEISFHQGWHEQAYQHYEQFYTCHNGHVSRDVLERLFLYATELQQRKKAIRYFKALFDDLLSRQSNHNEPSAQIMEALSLMTDKGWYDFVPNIYEKLVTQQPKNESLRHGLIRSLIKNNQMEKAQALV